MFQKLGYKTFYGCIGQGAPVGKCRLKRPEIRHPKCGRDVSAFQPAGGSDFALNILNSVTVLASGRSRATQLLAVLAAGGGMKTAQRPNHWIGHCSVILQLYLRGDVREHGTVSRNTQTHMVFQMSACWAGDREPEDGGEGQERRKTERERERDIYIYTH